VDQYVRTWKAERGESKPASGLPNLAFALGEEPLLGAALVHIKNRLDAIRITAGIAPVDRDELEALTLLRQELMKRVDWAD
jgi:hypothetical protein